MSVDVVRRCDSCRKDLAPTAAVFVVEASITVSAGHAVGMPRRDACSEPCALNLFRSLFREAVTAAAPIEEPRSVGHGAAY